MLKLILPRCKDCVINSNASFGRRYFLSEAYRCTQIWSNRFKSPVLQKVRLDELYNGIDKNLQQSEPVSAIDIDIFTNALKDDSYVDELREVLHKFRLTAETGNTFESTHYAAVRYFIDHGKTKELLDILDDRLNYGIYLDAYMANILLDDFLKAQDYESAAKVAGFLMLQEDFENKISESLSLYSCIKYLETYKPPEVVQVVEEKGAKPAKKIKTEEVKIRVSFLRNPHFDDHFDLRCNRLIVGKTIAMISTPYEDPLHKNCELIGWLYYRKLDKAAAVAKKICSQKQVFPITVELFRKFVELPDVKSDAEVLQSATAILSELEKVPPVNVVMENLLQESIQNSLNKYQEENVHQHSRLFDAWESLRETKFKEQIEFIETARLEKKKAERSENLRQLEEKIAFFDNEDQIDLKIESKRVFYRKRWFGKKKKPRAIDEGYIPPEVYPRRSKP